ncbi:hypothetical protein BSKO_03032 [Bryopsis sp. KO-2023]|nr:hypothetical protein BSKO_03032 [Bryopsis sp. KO-2023]
MEDAHAAEIAEVLEHFAIDENCGLNSQRVQEARAIHGRNELAPDEGTPFWKLVLKQFDDLLVKILIVAAVMDLLISLFSGETGIKALVEPGVIFLILLANAAVGVVTENNAEKAIEELKAYEANVATVLRDGSLFVIPSVDLVPGDVVEVAVGGKVPADIRLIHMASGALRIDQSILTGESGSVSKTTEPAPRNAVAQDKTCILFSGTMVTSGRARGIVIGTGAVTAIGKIRDAMADSTEEMTPLKKKLDEFGTFLSKVIAGICILVWVMNIGHFGDPIHGGVIKGAIYYFKIAVALAVAAIPEGLPAVVTTCLALGTRKMAKKNAIVRNLPSVETLGCTTVICSDKTGTLTTNNMSVCRVGFAAQGLHFMEYDVTGTTYSPEGLIVDVNGGVLTRPVDSQCLVHLAMCASLCNDSTLSYNVDTGVHEGIGESTEIALRVFAEKVGIPGYATPRKALEGLRVQKRADFCNVHWQEDYPRLAAIEFSSARRMMSVLCTNQGQAFILVKGAPEVVLARCSMLLTESSTDPILMTSKDRELFLSKADSWGASMSLRCLALAFKPIQMTGGSKIAPEHEDELILVGLVGMHDPPRSEAAGAIQACRSAGIRVIMVTGDNIRTAESIARQVGVLDSYSEEVAAGKALTGVAFNEMTPGSQHNAAHSISIFARVEPQHKSNLVDILKAEGEVVAVTGDGVNDAPALKKADIGVAMGSGTAVAKHAADMVLSDDNFATIVSAIEEGRAIYNNTRQFIRYMVSSNIGEVVAIFIAALLGIPETLNPVQLLWVNLVTDGLPATALGFNKPDKDIMRTKPRKMEDPVVGGWMFFRYLLVGLYVGIATVLGFIWWYLYAKDGPRLSWHDLRTFQDCVEGSASYSCKIFQDPTPSTMSVSILVMVEMFNALNALSENSSLFQLPPWENPLLLVAIGISVALHCFILYVPVAAGLFSVVGLGWDEWRMVLLLSFPVIGLDEILKCVSRGLVGGPRPRMKKSWSRLGSWKDLASLDKAF